jgi:aminoglycoside 6'-N-acetyltransferase I
MKFLGEVGIIAFKTVAAKVRESDKYCLSVTILFIYYPGNAKKRSFAGFQAFQEDIGNADIFLGGMMENYQIIDINQESSFLDSLVSLELKLWPDHVFSELKEDTLKLMSTNNRFFGVLCDNSLIAFIQVSVKTDYVNGTDSSPVGYLEGIFVSDSYRMNGIGKKLVRYAADFFRKIGIREMASDVLSENTGSHRFHKHVGFEETERVVFYRMKL